MKLPDNIKIGPFNYKLTTVVVPGNDAHGISDTDEKQITIFTPSKSEAFKETLQHEILHVLLEDLLASVKDIEDIDKQEEQLIRLFSPRLMSLAQENQELAKFLWMRKGSK